MQSLAICDFEVAAIRVTKITIPLFNSWELLLRGPKKSGKSLKKAGGPWRLLKELFGISGPEGPRDSCSSREGSESLILGVKRKFEIVFEIVFEIAGAKL